MRVPGGLFWVSIAFVAGIGNYAVKQGVQSLDDQLNDVKRKTAAAESKIHDLTAEWTYLNRPELLADLNRRYLGLMPLLPKQTRNSIEDLPMRPTPPPAPEPQVVAAAMPVPAPGAVAAAAPAPEPATPIMRAASAITPIDSAEAAPVTAAHTPRPTATERASIDRTIVERPKPPTLDALFAQVAGDR